MEMNTVSPKTGTVKTLIPAVILLFLLLYIVPLGQRPLIIPDESRYAEIPREMLASGDWIVPRLDGFRYFEKPVLGYWAIAASIGTFGENAFAVRLPSALSAGAAAVIIFILLARFGRGARAGFLAAAAYLTSLEVFAVGTVTVLDSLFTLFITAAMAAFFLAYRKERPGNRSRLLISGGIFAGLAFLTKGFIAFAIPVIVIVPYMLWERRGRELFRSCWVPVLAAGLIALPWAVLIHLREPDFWNYFFWTEHIRRFLSSEPQHPEPVWFFLPTIIWGALPGSTLLPAAVSGLAGKRLRDPLLRYAACWFFLPFILFSLSRGKLETYILPCFPPLIILLVAGTLDYFAAGKKKMFTVGATVLGILLIILAAGLVVIQATGFPVHRFFNRSENWKWIIAVAGFLIWALGLILSIRQKWSFKKLLLFLLAPVFLLFISHYIFPEGSKEEKAPEYFLREHQYLVTPETILVSDGYSAPALCWFYDRADVRLLEYPGELDYGITYADAEGRFLTFEQFRQLAGGAKGPQNIVLFLDSERFGECSGRLPPATAVVTGNGFTLARFEPPQKTPH